MAATGLDALIRASSPWLRPGMRVLVALGRRPRGRALLAWITPADQAAAALTGLERYDEPARARALGWDAAAVVARGAELRRREGRA